jgi:hypothetical protein
MHAAKIQHAKWVKCRLYTLAQAGLCRWQGLQCRDQLFAVTTVTHKLCMAAAMQRQSRPQRIAEIRTGRPGKP